jgi:hypothetical protein
MSDQQATSEEKPPEESPEQQQFPAVHNIPSPHDYSVASWYWEVGNRNGVVYSSGKAAYIDTSDQDYQDFLNGGNIATKILSDGELADVLATRGLQGLVVLNTQPTDWGGVQPLAIIAAVQAAGCEITSSGNASLSAHYQLVGEPYATMSNTQIYVNSQQPGRLPNDQPLPWSAYSGEVTFNTADDFAAVYKGLVDYLQSWKTWAYHAGTMPGWGQFTIA